MNESYLGSSRQRNVGLTIGAFLYLWMTVGVIAGALLWRKSSGSLEGGFAVPRLPLATPEVMVAVAVLAYLAASVFVARWLVGILVRTDHAWLRIAVPVTFTAAAAASLWVWFLPIF